MLMIIFNNIKAGSFSEISVHKWAKLDKPFLDGNTESELYMLLLYDYQNGVFSAAAVSFILLPSVLPFDFTV